MRKWMIWVAASALYLLVNFHRFALGVISDQLMAAFAIAAVGLGGLSSLYFYLYALLQLPAGILADTWGPRRTITASAVIMAVGSLVFGAAQNLTMAYVGRFLIGVGVAAVFVNILKLLADWFPPRFFATMTGLTTTVGFLGGFVASGPFAHVVEAVGWRWGFHGVGILTAVIGLGCIGLIRDRAAPSPVVTETRVLGPLWAVLKAPETWPVFFAKVGITGTFLAFFALWGPPYLMQVYGLTRAEAGTLNSLGLLGFIAGGTVIGFLSDRLFQQRKLPLLLAGSIYTLFWIGPAANVLPVSRLGPYLFAFGFFGSSLLLCLSCIKEQQPERVGVALAAVNTGGFLGAAVLQVLLGLVLDLNWQGAMQAGARLYPPAAFAWAFRLCLGLMGAAVLCIAWIREGPVPLTASAKPLESSPPS
ncbi:MAG: MFS transporter [Candidatus Methylomirabilales bacterium]